MIDFWVSIGSTYSYLSVMRLKSIEVATGVSFRWRPFSVRAIMIEQKNIPFVGKPVKMACATSSGAPSLTASSRSCPHPTPSANSISLTGSRSWRGPRAGARLTRAPPMRRGSTTDKSPAPSRAFPARCGRPDRTRTASSNVRSEEIGARYLAATEEAKALGVFGSPSFVVNGEVFWGDDRIDDAIRWIRSGRV